MDDVQIKAGSVNAVFKSKKLLCSMSEPNKYKKRSLPDLHNNRSRLCKYRTNAHSRSGCEAPSAMAAPVRTNQVNQVNRHPCTTFGTVIVKVNKRSVSADAHAFVSNNLLGVDLFDSKRTVEG